ncbi:putative membrane protein YesL [Geomicrobium halophilum]|uniref:Putative membrane protein YesL n=1 Tax=Geomicrobium halophilum TaxID=549000 RepID=A0A841PQ76_9BACL|nr:DUF624 domain-containing protein [Geomicrobium halophilum]MBB6450920.1 putative membrane protein YesL [Geomicrobium halophilum]
MQQQVNKIDELFQWLTRLAFLNILWIGASIAGLFVVGSFPALTSMLTVCRKWIIEGTEIPVFKTFMNAFKQDFWKVNIIGWVLLISAVILYINFELLMNGIIDFSPIVVFAYYFLVILFAVVAMNIFPLYVHYDTPLFNLFKNAVVIGFARIPITLAFFVLIGGVIYFSLLVPAVILFFSGSLLSFTIMRIMLLTTDKIDNRKQTA